MNFELLIQKLQNTHDSLYVSAAKSVNIAMTIRNWLYGYYIVEYEQNGEDRAKYGEKLIRTIEKRLKDSGQKGMSFTNLNIFRQFYLIYHQIGQALSDFLKAFPIVQALPDFLKEYPIIQALPEQLIETNQTQIIQAAPEQLMIPEKAVKKGNLSEKKIGIEPARILKTLSFTHIVELIKIDDPLKRAFYEMECVKGIQYIQGRFHN
ncbi:MAG: hypothetical protein HY738_21215 [Bacteroidia bacterium]|nr:hypothetical protein [Bacteroidia bacterium]